MVNFGDLKSEVGLKSLDDYLLSRSYISGYQPSQADLTTFQAVGGKPSEKFSNVLRWYSHIHSFGTAASHFPIAEQGGDHVSKTEHLKDSAADSDDIDLFGSDDDEEAERIRKERQTACAEKKAAKSEPAAKSTIVLDVKPWDDETDMGEIERCVRSIQVDGLSWGASKLVPLAYGIKKLQIGCVVDDDKVGTDLLEEEIMKFEDLVQSVDVAAFNKL